MYAALQSKLEQIRGIWRFRWTAMLVAWIVCLIGWLLVLAAPDTYSAWAQVHIDPSTRLSQITQTIGPESNVVAEAEAVREALVGSPQLDKVARAAIPGYAMASPEQQQRMVERLRKRVGVESNEVGPRSQPADLYTITYTDRSQLTAYRVVDQLLQQFLANLRGGTQEAAKQAQQFLKQQINECKGRLQHLEARLADFKKRNTGLLPGATGDYVTRLQAAKDQLDKLTSALRVAEQKRDAIHQQLSGEAAANLAADIREWEAKLRDLRQRFTDAHPDVIAARRTLEELRARQQEEIAAVKRGDAAATAATCGGANTANPEHQGICSQLSQAEVDVSLAKGQVDAQNAKIAELNKMIDTAPQVEAEYAELNRDYETTRSEYNNLVDRLNRATLSDEAEASGGAVRFTVIQPPTGSAMPVSPDRPRLILVVLLSGLAVGAGVAYLMNELRPVFYSGRQLGEIISLPVLGIVSMTGIERHLSQERRALWAYSAATAALVLVAVVALVVQSPTSHFIHALMG
jgi:polysaccharide chain length determinant protein (PEP-CTERM system associated)